MRIRNLARVSNSPLVTRAFACVYDRYAIGARKAGCRIRYKNPLIYFLHADSLVFLTFDMRGSRRQAARSGK